MIDIVSYDEDLVFADATAPKAANVCSVQLGSLEYAPNFGVDLDYFLQNNIEFQNSSFRAYLVERLAQAQINVSEVIELVESLSAKYTFKVGQSNTSGGLIS